MNKKYKVFAKLVFLIFLILIIAEIVLGENKASAAGLEAVGGISGGVDPSTAGILKPVKIIDTSLTIAGNQFWDAGFDYQIIAGVTIPASSSLSIGSGA